MENQIGEVTRHLIKLGTAGENNWKSLFPIVYDKLRELASYYMQRERDNHTLQATALVHEAYLRFERMQKVQWENRRHFFGVVANLMRQILIDHARTKQSKKRGGGDKKVSLDVIEDLLGYEKADELIVLDAALDKLAKVYPRQAELVKLRYFVGLNIEETALALFISPATAKRDWAMAKAWLYREITQDE